MNHVFISYSSKEVDIAKKICAFLEGENIPCWIAPRNVNPGENYATQIVNAIRNCDALVLLASNNTNLSGHVSNEVSIALANQLFSETMVAYHQKDLLPKDTDLTALIINYLSEGSNHCIKLKGLPGSAKNMLLQLVFYKMLDSFEAGKSSYLPIYISVSFYEKLPYQPGSIKEQMQAVMEQKL